MNPKELLMLDSLRSLIADDGYDPVIGRGSAGQRKEVDGPGGRQFIPLSMAADPEFGEALKDETQWQRLRCRHDFEFWCATCAYIKPKGGFKDAPCRPNGGQRRVIAVLEEQRLARRPMRIIVLKARQWGCSTLIQLYIAWLQTCVVTGLNAIIIAHQKDASSTVRGMYSKLLSHYPAELWHGVAAPRLTPFEGSAAIRAVAGRSCTLTIASSYCEDAMRGSDISLAHLTEVAYWRDTPGHSPLAVVQSVYGTVPLAPMTMIALESTACGIGNFFHNEWMRAKGGRSDKRPVFVPWYEIEDNRAPFADDDARACFAASLDAGETELWNMGLTLEQIHWHRCKNLEFGEVERFMAEFPATDTEAFACTMNTVFDPARVEALRSGCTKAAQRGEISECSRRFVADSTGNLRVWDHPRRGGSYVTAVDVGGRSAGADWSVIAVLRCGDGNKLPEVVAQWRGHIDHDLLAVKAEAIARYYCNALLVIESNTFETEAYGADGAGSFVLERLRERYSHLYTRRTYDTVAGTYTHRVGFHTNTKTKPMLIGTLIEAVREGLYIERDSSACDELLTYERRPNGSYGANPPNHDDILMTRAIALFIISTEHIARPVPAKIRQAPSW